MNIEKNSKHYRRVRWYRVNKQLFIGYLPRIYYYRNFYVLLNGKVDTNLFMVGFQSYFKYVTHKICQHILSTFLWLEKGIQCSVIFFCQCFAIVTGKINDFLECLNKHFKAIHNNEIHNRPLSLCFHKWVIYHTLS